MRFFYDTEFIEDGTTIELVSIGVVAEDGREYYAISTDFDPKAANPWVRENVLNQLPGPNSPYWMPREQIREQLAEFLMPTGNDRPELWAWVGAYDHVVLAQLWGSMADLPNQMPHYTRELRQYWEMAGRPRIPRQYRRAHNALADARHNKIRFDTIRKVLPLPGDEVEE